MHLNDLTDKALAAYADHVKHICVPHALCDNQRPRHFLNRTFAHWNESPAF